MTTIGRSSAAHLEKVEAPGAMLTKTAAKALAVLRISTGFVFLWAFFNKTFGWGFATPSARAWVNGGSPTKGFLSGVDVGPLQSFFHTIAGDPGTDWLFMLGLLGIGSALILGVMINLAAAAGSLMMVLMWAAVLPPENNPFMDDHLIYAGVLAVLALTGAGATLGLGTWWAGLPLVRRFGWLK